MGGVMENVRICKRCGAELDYSQDIPVVLRFGLLGIICPACKMFMELFPKTPNEPIKLFTTQVPS